MTARAGRARFKFSDHPANDWEPRIAVDRQGSAAVVWDSYRNGNYDVLLRRFDGGELDPLEAVAATEQFEGRASVAVALDGRVWVAWGEGAATWGKDSGPTTDPRWIGRGRELWIRWINQSSVYCVGSDITAPGGADHCIDADGRCRRRRRSGCRSGRTGPASGTSRRCCGPSARLPDPARCQPGPAQRQPSVARSRSVQRLRHRTDLGPRR